MLISGLFQVLLDEPGGRCRGLPRRRRQPPRPPPGLGAGAAAGRDAGFIPCCSG